MALSTQALILAIVYVLCVIVGLVMTIKAGVFNILSFIGVLLTLAFIALLVYDTQCLTSGNCTAWSWVRTVIYILFPAISLILGAFALFSKKKDDDFYPIDETAVSTETNPYPMPMSMPMLPVQPEMKKQVQFKMSEQYMNSPSSFYSS